MQYDSFTEEIHALILQRGREYFHSGAVQELMATPEGWTAVVAGGESYHVVITGVDMPEEWYCNCPHDQGPVCKHVAAVLYAIREIKGLGEEE